MRRVRALLLLHRHDAHRRRRRVRLHPRLDHGRVRVVARGRQDPGDFLDAGRFYSGNQGNADKWAPEMRAYARHLQRSAVDDDDAAPFSYRYIGALVGDFHRTLLYGGIWLYPPDSSAPEGKARLLYEVAPMGFMEEQAGGAATRGPLAKDRVVEVVPEHIHQRSPMFVGSKTMVGGLQAFLAEREA